MAPGGNSPLPQFATDAGWMADTGTPPPVPVHGYAPRPAAKCPRLDAAFAPGRAGKGGDAIALVGVDEKLSPEVLAEIAALPQVREARALVF